MNKTEYLVDTKTDLLRIFHDPTDVFMYLEENNLPDEAVEWYFENEYRIRVIIPLWHPEQESYCESKREYCKQWGCE